MGCASDARIPRSGFSDLGVQVIRILAAQPAIQQHHLVLRNVVAKTESPRAQPVLAFTRPNPMQLFDRIFLALVVRVQREDCDRLFKPLHKFRAGSGAS